jgi:hypothetical protein
MRSAIIASTGGNRWRAAVARSGLPVLVASLAVLGLQTSLVSAAQPSPGWAAEMVATPSGFSAGDNTECLNGLNNNNSPRLCDAYHIKVRNAGSVASDGSTVTLTVVPAAGLTVQRVGFSWSGLPQEDGGPSADLAQFGLCTSSPVQCQLPTGELGLPPVAPDDQLEMVVYVTVQGAPGALTGSATVTGGGAPEVSASLRNAISDTPPAFGFEYFNALNAGLDGLPETQAGAHPYEFTTRVELNSRFRPLPENTGGEATSIQDVKDVVVDLPLGFLGSALAAPECTLAQLSSEQRCPPDTAVGHLYTAPGADTSVDSPLYNVVPEHGVAAEFGYYDQLKSSHVLYSSVVPSPAGYLLRSIAPDVPQVQLTSIEAVLYGNPAEKAGTGNAPVALFTNPAACTGEPLRTSIHMDSWQSPGRMNPDGTPDLSDPAWTAGASESPPVTGCNLLRFEPSLSARPETTTTDAPTGLEVELKVPQNETPGSLATPPLRDASATLPAGLTVNPSAATGLGACTEAQIALGSPDAPTCPESSKVGSVEVSTPALPGVLTGSIYLAAQNENPFHTLLAGYIVIDDPTTGVMVKIPGSLTPDPSTGQITGVFKENPQFPVSDLKLHFFGGARGELATPNACGTFTTTSDLMPWSAPDSGPDATPSDSFPINAGCANAFNPGFTAGSVNPQAAGYSPFTLFLTRSDGEQNLAGLTVTLPPGLLGKIAGIPLCPDANANAGTCPESSLLGSVQAGAGVGPNPLFVGGRAYLTGPYNGGPYGLVVEVPAVAGPFNLGTVVVRQSLRIDPHTSQVTAVSDPFPTTLDGIPLRIRRVDVTLDRPGFMFNPTNCTPLAINGTVTSTQGASANVSSRFQAGGCRELPFKPTFKVSTQAGTSKKNGASLDVKVGSTPGQANIGKVAVTLPKALPSRLTTIQQACPEATFNANPASCPAGSNIGVATARTPVLANPVVGPAYLVSHGGAAFPDLVLVLQSEGIKLELVGSVNIKKQVTSSAFNSVPDAPISSFELKLPEGPHSGLTAVLPAKAKGNLCGTSLIMPTTMTGQNGAVLKQNTKIAVTGCTKAKKKPSRGAHGKHRKAKPKKGTKKGK